MPKKDLDSLMEKHYGKETELSEEEILAAKEQEEKERVEAEEAERIKKEEEEGKKKKKIGRNNPCPCGSGIKYKHCCGKNI